MPSTLKLKPAVQAADAEGNDGVFVASRHANPMEALGAPRPENWTVAVVMALASTILVGATLMLLFVG